MGDVVSEKIVAYSRELGCPLTLDELIESHRHLRSLNLEKNNERRTEMEEARRTAYADASKLALEQGWFSKERLRGMTLAELTNLLYED